MFNRYLRIFPIIFFSLGLCTNLRAKEETPPDWVINHPIHDSYFIGISSCSKKVSDFKDIAKQKALNDLSSSILVIIKSETVLDRMELDFDAKQQFKSRIIAKTQQQLEGYELVDDWQDKENYWIYYRLSKKKYYDIKRVNFTNALEQAGRLLKEAQEHISKHDYYQAFISYILATKPLQAYLTETFDSELQSKCYSFFIQSKTELLNIFSNFQIEATQNRYQAHYGHKNHIPIQILIVFVNELSQKYPVKNLPIEFKFQQGTGRLSSDLSQTDYQGIAKTSLISISSDKQHSIAASISLSQLLHGYENEFVICQFLKQLTPPSDIIYIDVAQTKIFITSEEKNLGKPLPTKLLEPELRHFLENYGFEFTNDKAAASYSINIRTNTRTGNYYNGMYATYLDGELNVVETKSQTLIFSSPLNSIKGIQLNYNSAGIAAYQNAIKKFQKTLYPELLDFYQMQ